MAGKFLLTLLVLGPAFVFTARFTTPFEMYIKKFDQMYNQIEAKNPSASKEKICESIPKSIDDEVAQGIKLMEAENSKNESPGLEEVMKDAFKKTMEQMKERQGIMCKIRINENDWATLKAAVAKTNAYDKNILQCFTDLENELAGHPHLQGEIKQWVKLVIEMRAFEEETKEKVMKIREADVKEMYGKLMSGKISMKDLSGADLYNVVGQMAQEGKLKPGGPFTNVKQN